jgi:hypothetical protein
LKRLRGVSALGATNYDTDHSDFQEAIVANSIADSCAHRACSFLL